MESQSHTGTRGCPTTDSRQMESQSHTETKQGSITDSEDIQRVRVIQELENAPLLTLETDEESHKPGNSSSLLN